MLDLLDVILSNRLDISVSIWTFEKVHNDLEAKNDVNNILNLVQLSIVNVRFLENKAARKTMR